MGPFEVGTGPFVVRARANAQADMPAPAAAAPAKARALFEDIDALEKSF